MIQYLDNSLIHSSTDFIIAKLKEDKDYNLFVEYDDCEADKRKRSGISSIYYSGRNPSLLQKFCLIRPKLDIRNKNLEKEIKDFKLNIELVNDNLDIEKYRGLIIENEVGVISVFEQIFFGPILDYFNTKFDNFSVIRESSNTSLSKPDITISFEKENEKFLVPVEFKISGLRDAFSEREYNQKLNELLLQVGYQMIFSNTNLALIIDTQSIIVIKITDKSFQERIDISKIDDGFSYPLELQISIFDHGSTTSLISIVAIVINSQIKNVNKNSKSNMEKLKTWISKSDTEIQLQDANRYKIVEGFYKLTFSTLKLDKIRKVYTNNDLEVPMDYYVFLHNLEISENPILEHQFEINSKLQGCTLSEKGIYNSQVALVRYIGPGVNKNKCFVLKVYNPVYGHKSGSSKKEFYKGVIFSLSMYCKEIECYKILRENSLDGITFKIPNSAGSEGVNGHVNYVPYIMSYGFIKWKSPFIGYYILEQYLPDAKSTISKSEAWQLASKALKYIHSKGILHGDIKLSNLIYADGRIYFIDFGLSSISKFKGTNINFEKAKQLEMLQLKYVIDNFW
ncbi:uncharacterized protein RJT21DRAFT_126450 [Scheffersomyces amazonensis]|uniref:uncharacterized protein n=1 Tax=Scheffersomyces amazonensis TaxID=1078765 RepID=UPI00315CB8BC